MAARTRCPIPASGCRWRGLLSEHADSDRHPPLPAPHVQPDRPHRDRRQRRGHRLALDRARRHAPRRRAARALRPDPRPRGRAARGVLRRPPPRLRPAASPSPAPHSSSPSGSSSSRSNGARSSPTANSAWRPGGRPPVARSAAPSGANPIPIIVPCHRVLGSDGRITGYSGGDGIPTKSWLLDPRGHRAQRAGVCAPASAASRSTRLASRGATASSAA